MSSMAKIMGVNLSTGKCWFSLSPVLVPDGDATSYVFTWYSGSGPEWSRTYSVEGWFTPQDDVWVLSRMFAESPGLSGATIPVDLWRTGRHAQASLVDGADWLHLSLTVSKTRGWLTVNMFAKEDVEGDLFRRFTMRTSLQEAQVFGSDLEMEILSANPIWAGTRKSNSDALNPL